jgi:hypothetical protein
MCERDDAAIMTLLPSSRTRDAERYYRSLKKDVKLEHSYTPWQDERAVAGFVEHDDLRRYDEALQNVTPADVLRGRRATILAGRAAKTLPPDSVAKV